MYPDVVFLIIVVILCICIYFVLHDLSTTANIVSAIASSMLVATYLTNMNKAGTFLSNKKTSEVGAPTEYDFGVLSASTAYEQPSLEELMD